MSLLRGYADDQPLMPWLEQHIWPAEAAHVSEEFVRDGTELAIAEMMRSAPPPSATCISSPTSAPQPPSAGHALPDHLPDLRLPHRLGRDADEYISKGLALRDDVKHSELVNVGFGPHAPYTVSGPNLVKVATLAAELDTAVHIHLHETAGEVLQAVEQTASARWTACTAWACWARGPSACT